MSCYKAYDDDSERVEIHGFSKAFRKAGDSLLPNGDLKGLEAPTLDQAARMWYEKQKGTKYTDLWRLMACRGAGGLSLLLEHEIGKVYLEVLQAADVIVTTPVTATKYLGRLQPPFNPALVIFDEAPHARELSTLIAIANFNPAAWLFTGDHRQTKPWVGSHGKRPAINMYVEQLRVSMMERAYLANPSSPSLLINHRAHGNLQELGSKLFYEGKLLPAKDPSAADALPPSTLHLRREYIMPLKSNDGQEVSRLLVILKAPGPPERVQGSWYHPQHEKWTMRLVTKLLQDPKFLQVDGKAPGHILIMSPYKQSFLEYQKAIRNLKKSSRHLEKCVLEARVEARTVATAQGHEADFVILDLVRDR